MQIDVTARTGAEILTYIEIARALNPEMKINIVRQMVQPKQDAPFEQYKQAMAQIGAFSLDRALLVLEMEVI